MTQKELERIRKLYTIKFPVGYQYSQARDDVTALLNEIDRLKALHEEPVLYCGLAQDIKDNPLKKYCDSCNACLDSRNL
jgi:hypothetical protein